MERIVFSILSANGRWIFGCLFFEHFGLRLSIRMRFFCFRLAPKFGSGDVCFIFILCMFVFLFEFLAVLLVGAVLLVLKEKALAELVTLGIGELLERREVRLVVLYNGLVDDLVLNFRGCLATLEDEEDERFEEVLLLTEVLGILGVRNLERVHRDGLLLRVGDVSTFEIAAYTIVRVSCIDHHNVSVLLQELADDAVHVELIFNDFYR